MRQIIINLDSSDKTLIFRETIRQGENLGSEIIVNLNGEFTGYHYLMRFKLNDNETVPTEELFAVNGQVKYPIPVTLTVEAGVLKVVFEAYEYISESNTRTIKSAITTLPVAESLDGGTEIVPEPYVPWYTQAVEQATIATTQAGIATTKAEEAAQSANDASTAVSTHNTSETAHEDIREQITDIETNKADKAKMFYPDNIYGGKLVDNINTISVTGFYTAYGSSVGVPYTYVSWYIQHINSSVGVASAYQKIVSFDKVYILYRYKIANVWGAFTPLPASQIGLADAGDYFTGTNPEAALQEVGAKLADIATNKADNSRVDLIITTPVEGVSAQEIIDARQGEASLGAKFTKVGEQINDLDAQFNSTSDKESAVLGNELLDATGWNSDGWTGDFATGFIHTVGQTTPLSRSMGATGTKVYEVEFTIASPTSKWNVTVSIGNSVPFEIYTGDGTVVNYKIGIKSVSDGNLVFTPESTFDGTITNISVKEVIGTYEATTIIKDSNDANTVELRNNKADLNNIFIGKNSGKQNFAGNGNLAVGNNALENNVGGFWNTALGYLGLANNIGGSRNVAVGFQALFNNVSGQRNIAVGTFALGSNKTGIKNVAIGSDTLIANTVGNENIAIGHSALQKNIDGYSNVSIAPWSLTRNTTGYNNVAIGMETLFYNATGYGNVAIGRQAGYSSTGKDLIGCTLVGYRAGIRAANNYNTCIGFSAGENQTIGQDNVYIGKNAGFGTSGHNVSKNIAIGTEAGYLFNTGADNNICIGYQAGKNVKTGINNIIIGYQADFADSALSNHLNIGGTIYGDLLGDKVGIGVVSPTARLHLKFGTTEVAPIKFESGALNTIAQAGALEYDGTDLYFTNSTGTRKKITMV